MALTLTQKRKEFILTEPLSKVMWKLSIPAIFAMVLYGLNAFMDTVYIGQLLSRAGLGRCSFGLPTDITYVRIGLMGRIRRRKPFKRAIG